MTTDDTGNWGQPNFLASGAPDLDGDPNDVSDYYAAMVPRRFTTLALAFASTPPGNGYLARGDDAPGALLVRFGGAWVMHGVPAFASTGARDTAITAPAAGDRARVGSTHYLYNGSAWRTWNKPWAAYTPTLANWTSTAPTTNGRWCVAEGVVNFIAQSKLGTGTITVGAVTVTLPIAADTTSLILASTLISGVSGFKDVTASPDASYSGPVRLLDANTVTPLRESTAGTFGALTSASPFTWATLDELNVAASYPVGA